MSEAEYGKEYGKLKEWKRVEVKLNDIEYSFLRGRCVILGCSMQTVLALLVRQEMERSSRKITSEKIQEAKR